MSDDLEHSENRIPQRIPELGDRIGATTPAARKWIVENLLSLMETAYQRGKAVKNSSKVRQRWFTIFGYLAQVSERIVRDLEYDQLITELEELKKKVAASDVTRTRRTIISQNYGTGRAKGRKPNKFGDSDRSGRVL